MQEPACRDAIVARHIIEHDDEIGDCYLAMLQARGSVVANACQFCIYIIAYDDVLPIII